MIAFRQVHKVLALERTPPPAARKRSGTEASNEGVQFFLLSNFFDSPDICKLFCLILLFAYKMITKTFYY